MLISALLFGLAVTLMLYIAYQMFTVLPTEDRSFLDRPPRGFLMVWPLVRFGVYWSSPLLRKNYRVSVLNKLRRAGQDYALGPEQFFGGKLAAAVVGLLFAALIGHMLENFSIYFFVMAFVIGFFYPDLWLRETITKREKRIFRDLPYYLDIITLSVEAGTNLTTAFAYAVQKSPQSPLNEEIKRILRDVRAGKPRATCLREFADRLQMPAVDNLVSSLIQAEKIGSSLGPILRAQSQQRRSERFTRAEKLAMEAPVKLLGPLIMFIFPTTFMVLGFIIVVKAVVAGVITFRPLIWALTWPG